MDAAVLVAGAGPAGLAVTACLKRRGIEPLVIDRGDGVGDSWRSRYDRLHLHTPRIQSHLPGFRHPRRSGRWIARDEVARYLGDYARTHSIEPRFGVELQRIAREDGHWVAGTSAGNMRARQVVVATGYNNVPKVPDWPGRDDFPGEILHSSRYRNPRGFAGKDVLVVGTGNSGAEIATDLAEGGARTVRLAVRTPPHIVPRQLGPIPTTLLSISQDFTPAWLVDPVNRALQRWFVGDLTAYGLPAPRQGLVAQFREKDVVPIIDVGLIEQLRAGRVEPVAAVERFDGGRALLADGTGIEPDVVIAATGYETALGPIVGHLGVLDAAGRPRVHGARSWSAAPGLRFIGLSNPLKGLLFQINIDARAAARAVSKELRAAGGR